MGFEISLGPCLEALKEAVGVHRLLLVEILDLTESDALHAARRCTCRTPKHQGVVLGVTGWLRRQVQHLCRLTLLRELVILHGEVSRHQI